LLYYISKNNNLPEYHIHDIVNLIESRDIPLLAEFFNKNIELFEKLKNGIDLIK